MYACSEPYNTTPVLLVLNIGSILHILTPSSAKNDHYVPHDGQATCKTACCYMELSKKIIPTAGLHYHYY